MKPFVKYALAGIALVAASGAYADVQLPSTGNGELALFVRDLSNPSRAFEIGLGVTLDGLLTQDAITNTPGLATTLRNGQPIAVAAALPNFSSADLATFMSTPSALGYQYAILGGDNVGSNAISDAWRFVATNKQQYSASALSSVSSTQINNTSGMGNIVDAFFAENNLNMPHTPGSFITNSTFGVAGTNGATAPTFFSANVDDTVAVGTATNLYMFTSSGSSSAKARVYQFAAVTLGLNGSLTSASVGGPQVPLPAAVWLLGSALVGFGTVRRRRNAEAVA
jgi:hypothetical protein